MLAEMKDLMAFKPKIRPKRALKGVILLNKYRHINTLGTPTGSIIVS
nr:MAG TPA: hypothetical protein [Caudoviricetes sp.]